MSDEEIARLRKALDNARHILDGSSGLLHSQGTFGGVRKPVWKVIVNGNQVSMWSRKYQARMILREHLREERRRKRTHGQ